MTDDILEPRHIDWPRQIWMAERTEHDQGVVSAVLSEHATIARYEGDRLAALEYHPYVDMDVWVSAEKYWRGRVDHMRTPEMCAHNIEVAVAQALAEQEQDWCLNVRGLTQRLGIGKDYVLAACRSLRDRGYATFQRGLWTEDGTPAGSGYAITPQGRSWLKTGAN